MIKFSPLAIASAAGLMGCAFIVAGVYVLAGAGWALVGSGLPLVLFAVTLVRGLSRAE